MSEPSETKWSCEYCTYENFPSSLKCTMCRGPRPFVSEDIYRLHGSERSLSNTNLPGLAAGPCENKVNRGKWSCEICMYVNQSKDQLCSQCSNPAPSSPNTLHEHIQPLRITQNSDIAQSLSRSRTNSPPTSLTNIENSRRTTQKWMCTVSIFIRRIFIVGYDFNILVLDVYL